MMPDRTIKQLLKEYLKALKYDGLCLLDHDCGCGFDDFMPCGEPSPECEAAYGVKTDDGYILFYPMKKDE